MEHAEIIKAQPAILHEQSYLQYGFTKGLSPLGASVIISEAIAVSKKNKVPLFIATLDAQKAFDTVSHEILLHTMNQDPNLEQLKNITEINYSNLQSCVNWKGECGTNFEVKQGVRQGGVLSSHLYKLYINPLLHELETAKVGFCINNVYFGAPTCADDLVLLANSQADLQTQLNIVERFASERRYLINASKSSILISGQANDLNYVPIFTLNNTSIPILQEISHLGINRVASDTASKLIADRICLGRRTLYSLIGSGIHGANGVGIDKCLTIYTTYVLPVILHGLDSVHLQAKCETELEKFHSQTIKHLQGLPTRTATHGAYSLSGTLPMTALLDKAKLSLLRCMLTAAERSDEMTHFLIMGAQSCVTGSWTNDVTTLLAKYQLPDITVLIQEKISKTQWKSRTDKAIDEYWSRKITEECRKKSSLKRLKLPKYRRKHKVWSRTSGCRAVREATIKARMICGVYLLQVHRQRFNQFQVDATCMLCHEDNEDLTHFIASCSAHRRIREFHLPRITTAVNLLNWTSRPNLEDPETLTQVILDFEVMDEAEELQNEDTVKRYEEVTRHFCYEMHVHRHKAVGALVPRKRGRQRDVGGAPLGVGPVQS